MPGKDLRQSEMEVDQSGKLKAESLCESGKLKAESGNCGAGAGGFARGMFRTAFRSPLSAFSAAAFRSLLSAFLRHAWTQLRQTVTPCPTPQSAIRNPQSEIPSPSPSSAFRFPLSAFRRPRRDAFTLTELLIVIAIIGVLASLITAAAINALNNAKRTRIVLEIKNMSGAIEDFKNNHGAYPPNAMNLGSSNPQIVARVRSDFERMAKKAFPRIHPDELMAFRGLAGDTTVDTAIVTSGPVAGGLTAAQALYFWLGGFSSDPQFPLSGPGGPSFIDNGTPGDEVLENRQNGYEFALGRLGPRTDGELDASQLVPFTYKVDMNGSTQVRTINLWSYYPEGSERPYIYFDCSRYKPAQYDVPAFSGIPGAPEIFPILQLATGVTETGGLVKNLIFANQKKFQILHAGLDDAWGPEFANMGYSPAITNAQADNMLIFPTGPFIGEIGDTLTNFADGELSASQDQ